MIRHIERTASKFGSDGYTQGTLEEHGILMKCLKRCPEKKGGWGVGERGRKKGKGRTCVYVGKQVIVSHLHMQNPNGGSGIHVAFSSGIEATSNQAQAVCVSPIVVKRSRRICSLYPPPYTVTLSTPQGCLSSSHIRNPSSLASRRAPHHHTHRPEATRAPFRPRPASHCRSPAHTHRLPSTRP